jgi:predicted nucleotidyltransferase
VGAARPPAPVATLVAELARLPGAVAVALLGSRATGTAGPDSDWDVGVYYRGSRRPLDPGDVRRLGHPGHVSELGEWGPVMDGGAWLTVAGAPVDVLFRDLDVAEARLREAEQGRFEVVAQSGCVVGAPTYASAGELATCRPLAGSVPRPGYPEALAATAPPRWRDRARLWLLFAGQHARGGDAVACAGMLAGAVLCAAHARLAERREWAPAEKRLVARAGLGAAAGPLLAAPGGTAAELTATTAAVAEVLGVEPLRPR